MHILSSSIIISKGIAIVILAFSVLILISVVCLYRFSLLNRKQYKCPSDLKWWFVGVRLINSRNIPPPTLWSYGTLNFFSRYFIAEGNDSLSPSYPQTFAKSIVLFNFVASVIPRLSVSCHPRQVVKSPYGSASTSNTFFPCIARPIPRLTEVVVFPTPPFWLQMAIVLQFDTSCILLSWIFIAIVEWLCTWPFHFLNGRGNICSQHPLPSVSLMGSH